MAIINKSARKILLGKVGRILETTVQVQDQWARKRKREGRICYPSMVEKVLDTNHRIYDDTDTLTSDIRYTIATTSWLKDIEVVCGCTRVVMMFKTGRFKNLVVKIPYGTVYDYCKGEVQNYKQAPDELKPFLARSEYLGKVTIHSYATSKTVTLPVYIMKKVKDVDNISNAHNINMKVPYVASLSAEDYQKIQYAYDRCSSAWVMNLLYEYMGIEKFLKFLDYIEKNRINDLHTGNIGSLDGRPVLFDYAGFREEEDDDYDDSYYDNSDSYDSHDSYASYDNYDSHDSYDDSSVSY